MDGAAKFVRGDVMAGLVITVINIVGGLTIGVVRHGMALSDAAATFTTLTIGDGLVSQIPALLVSTAAGIVVTKGGITGRADKALMRQLARQPQAARTGRRCGRPAVADARPALPALHRDRGGGRRRRLDPPSHADGPARIEPEPQAVVASPNAERAARRADARRHAARRARLRPAWARRRRPAPPARADQVAAPLDRDRDGLRAARRPHPGQHAAAARDLRGPHQGDRGGPRRSAHHAPADHGPEGRRAPPARREDQGARLRPARDVDRAVAQGRGAVPRLHRGRCVQRADHPPHRGHPRGHGRPADLRRDRRSCSTISRASSSAWSPT